uniref:Carboxypeptidase n=1 Tax=Pyramimonas obovata TaxID=1411642 RepID=A0A7S0NA43_9CHLO|mmetsp:Transcript_23619/g.51551  ORF Transcript_23619/g.51551 Transcript_23619/m.51551 type:complete len:461 (+) Transcript_23619:100-1482(+)|eukprot:CAMPEP_0118954448 /NCGR_PEP_ID=MMETSP1169-20130426/58232_1 /TAXON_ID=36882 /ORGANISM="Pyramimonas obovata, Strain CCMP722" /LENGTH=460 /DNA_ID=CAMNT_0006902075 /DNA_START=81 /DNA_END=1463 /DNA_ORIENTATION=-
MTRSFRVLTRLAAVVACVGLLTGSVVESRQLNIHESDTYIAGYVTVDTPSTAGEIFYWFCPPRDGNVSAPLNLWIQGGPGSSGIAWGLLKEHGPYELKDGALVRRELAWNNNHAVLYVDQPVGTGYSIAKNASTYAQDEHAIAEGLLDFMYKWYALGHWNKSNPFFITGESYAGHYVPAFAHHIVSVGATLNLQGVAIGDGFTDPQEQVLTKPLQAYGFSLIDRDQLKLAQKLSETSSQKCAKGDYLGALRARSAMESLVSQSGINLYDVRIFGDYSEDDVKTWLNQPEVKAKLNVPADRRWHTDPEVGAALEDDYMRSWGGVIPDLVNALPHGVLLYQGQFDWKDGVTSNQAWLSKLDWPDKEAFNSANRTTWYVDGKPKGWIKSAGKLIELVVGGAGHMVPMDQPEAALDMVTRFIQGQPFDDSSRAADDNTDSNSSSQGEVSVVAARLGRAEFNIVI